MGWRTSSPLSASNVSAVITELEQTAVAVSVMGTTARKLMEMANLVKPILGALVGERPEVERIRKELRIRERAVWTAATAARPASDALRNLVATLRKVKGLINKDLGDVEAKFEVESFEVVNTWGYNRVEYANAKKVLGDTARSLKRAGLDALSIITVNLNPAEATSFVGYQADTDSLVMDLRRSGTMYDVLYSLGTRLWSDMRSSDREIWGNSDDRFRSAFADALEGSKKPSPDVRARLQLSIGYEAAS